MLAHLSVFAFMSICTGSSALCSSLLITLELENHRIPKVMGEGRGGGEGSDLWKLSGPTPFAQSTDS